MPVCSERITVYKTLGSGGKPIGFKLYSSNIFIFMDIYIYLQMWRYSGVGIWLAKNLQLKGFSIVHGKLSVESWVD